jgi:cytochrome c oxidase subunit 1
MNYLKNGYSVRSWLLSTDHKRIAILYLLAITAFFWIGGFAAMIIRLQLLTPNGHLVQAQTYNKLFTMHGVVMVFLFLIPAIPAVLGNFLVPIMIGAKDLAFPRLNLASWYVFMAGGALIVASLILGGVDTGWTFYPPYSSLSSTTPVTLMALGVIVNGFSSIFTGINFIATIHRLRAPGMTWFKMPLFIWSMYATSLIFILGTPVLTIALIAIALERLAHLGIFTPSMGGDPLLFQHLFWFYSHPAVYIMVLPAMGVVSEIVPCFARRQIFGYAFIASSSMAIAVIGFFVWGHHMFVSGQSEYAGLAFSLFSMLVAIPSAIKVFNWTATLYKGRVYLRTPMLYALGFIGLFTMGGLTGLMLASLGLDVHVHDTYFVIAHFHFIMVGGSVMAYLGGIHFWWPKISGRLFPEFWGKISAAIIFIGFILTFLPQFILGYAGMPRRYYHYAPEFQVLNVFSTAGASILAVGYILPLVYLIWSIKYGPVASANPWRATGLEWQIPSPPPTHNFEDTPKVDETPYDYGGEPMDTLPPGRQGAHA